MIQGIPRCTKKKKNGSTERLSRKTHLFVSDTWPTASWSSNVHPFWDNERLVFVLDVPGVSCRITRDPLLATAIESWSTSSLRLGFAIAFRIQVWQRLSDQPFWPWYSWHQKNSDYLYLFVPFQKRTGLEGTQEISGISKCGKLLQIQGFMSNISQTLDFPCHFYSLLRLVSNDCPGFEPCWAVGDKELFAFLHWPGFDCGISYHAMNVNGFGCFLKMKP